MFKWNSKRLFKNYFTIGEGKTTTSKIKIFSLSITLGLLASFAILAIFVGNPFAPVFDGIGKAFESEQGTKSFLNTLGILGIAGISVAVGFKTGLFNMGVSGQMIIGGFTTGIIAINLGDSVPNGVGQVMVLLLSMLLGSLFACISGALKAYFNVHEVVSTILLNWIAFFFMRWMLDPNTSSLIPETGTGLFSKEISDNFLLRFNGNSMWPVFIILISTAAIMWFVIFKTSFGMKLKMTGLNKDAAKAAGVNTKAMTISSMAISGAVAGLLGAVLYFGQQNAFAVPKADVVPQTGFDGIAIALISFSNPILIVPTAALFSLIQTGIAFSNGQVDVIFISLVLGVLMFVSAIGSMWNRFHFNKWIRVLIYGKDFNTIYEKHRERIENISKDSNDKYVHALSKQDKEQIMLEDIKIQDREREAYLKAKIQIIDSSKKHKDTIKQIKLNGNGDASLVSQSINKENELFAQNTKKIISSLEPKPEPVKIVESHAFENVSKKTTTPKKSKITTKKIVKKTKGGK